MPNSQYCCFTGHRNLSKKMLGVIESRIKDEIVWLVSHGVDRFITGGARGFDLIAGRCVLELRASNPRIKLIIVTPCLDQDFGYNPADKLEYHRLLRAADKVIRNEQRYFTGCMQARDRYMVDRSSICVSWLERKSGGTYYTVQYALQASRVVVNLANLNDVMADIAPSEEYALREEEKNDLDKYFEE